MVCVLVGGVGVLGLLMLVLLMWFVVGGLCLAWLVICVGAVRFPSRDERIAYRFCSSRSCRLLLFYFQERGDGC